MALATLAGGCQKRDKESLARVGSRLTAQMDDLTAGTETKLSTGWQSLRADREEATLDARVSARLRWDKTLADTPIHVHATGSVVELTGTVRDLAQRRRAVHLAEST